MCRSVLHPLVKVLIRWGVSAGEFKAIVDSVYAQAGSEYLSDQGQRVTYSRLSVITGINRSFLPAILSTPHDRFQPRSQTQLHRSVRVMNGWYDDASFKTGAGEPAVLGIDGPGKTFQQLVRRYSGGIYHRTVLSELERVGAVKLVGADSVRAIRRSPTTVSTDADSLYTAGRTAGALLRTLEHNLLARDGEQLPIRSLSLMVDARCLPRFRAYLAKRADGLLDVVEDFLGSYRLDGKQRRKSQQVVLGAAIFPICDASDRVGRINGGNRAAPRDRG
jgi:hypothetical protein